MKESCSLPTRGWGRSIAVWALVLLQLFAWSGVAAAYDVEADSASNTVFVLLRNLNPSADFQSVSVSDALPAFVSQATASIVPASVPASGSDLAAVEFDVSPGALAGSSGDLELTVSGTADGQPVQLVLTVPLEVVADAPAAQGSVGVGVPAPDPGGVDTDGDGVSDALEIAFGSDPANANSLPGKATSLPALGALALAVLASWLLITGAWITRRRTARGLLQ